MKIGKNNQIGQFTSFDNPAEIVGIGPYNKTEPCHIGNDNIIREFCVIQERTQIGDNNYILGHVHICHDCKIGNFNVISSGSVLAGHVKIHDHVTIGINASFHQYVTVGAYAMIGMGSVVVEDVPPFSKVMGNPARVVGTNSVGIARAKFTEEEYVKTKEEAQKWFDQNHIRKIMKSRPEVSDT